ncbi:MAG: biotin-dependent carboxyltransferase family protein, partial [Ornithinimicrobium sp.]
LGSRLVAHGPGRAALEVTMGGLVARVHGSLTLALTGADAEATLDGQPLAHAAPVDARDGQELRLGMPSAGLRTYLCVRGGFEADAVLGSRSTDTLAGLGPSPVAEGDLLTVGEFEGAFPNVDVAPVARPTTERVVLTVTAGPRTQWFQDADHLGQRVWTVSERSNRIGQRLQGEPLERVEAHADDELPSEGMVRGCVQVPPDGQPVVFGNDHPVTGGYPVIAVVSRADMDRAAQLTPGQEVVLRWKQ